MLLDDHNLVAVVTMMSTMRPVFGTGAMMVVVIRIPVAELYDVDYAQVRNVMSKFMALGLSLEPVAAATTTPRRRMDCFAKPVIGRAFARPAGSQ